MAKQQAFYGPHTEQKLEAVTNYLSSFLTVVSKQNFETVYVDAFAGSGELPLEFKGDLLEGIEDARQFIEGSAVRALQLPRRFDKYIFIEKDKQKLAELRARLGERYVAPSKLLFREGDAAEELQKLSDELTRPNVRSVVFLDPCGSQVSWDVLCRLAATQHVDLWYLFPAGLSVFMQMPSDGRLTPEQERSFERLFGPNDWRSEFRKTETVRGLFDQVEVTKKAFTTDGATRFMISCMKKIFRGGVSDHWLPLGRGGAHWYSLVFAMANPSPKARAKGLAIAKHILTRK